MVTILRIMTINSEYNTPDKLLRNHMNYDLLNIMK